MNELLLSEFKLYLKAIKALDYTKKIRAFKQFIESDVQKGITYNEILDFIDIRFGFQTRWRIFSNLIRKNYPVNKYKKILEISAGYPVYLSRSLTKYGYNCLAYDPRINENIRIPYKKELFDYRTAENLGFDLIIGQKACEGVEHGVRFGIKHKIPFVFELCITNHHKTIHDERKFKSSNEFYKYLLEVAQGSAVIEEFTRSNKKMLILRSKQ